MEHSLNESSASTTQALTQSTGDPGVSLNKIGKVLQPSIYVLAVVTVLSGLSALGVSNLIPPTFTARVTFISPQQQQSSAAAALASFSALSTLAGASSAIKNPADQYVALIQSTRISDRIIDRFSLQKIYESKLRIDAQTELASNVRINTGKKDSLITVEFDDHDPKRAADIANAYVEELQQLLNQLAITEAQQRRVFFEQQLQKSKVALSRAQAALQETGFTDQTLRSEPKAAAETYAKTKAEVTAIEMRLSALRRSFTDTSVEVQSQQAALEKLRGHLATIASPQKDAANRPDYISAYREFKYQEALFEIYVRQFELARLDEGREGTLIQVLDTATPPERKSRPRRMPIVFGTAVLAFIASCSLILFRKRKQL